MSGVVSHFIVKFLIVLLTIADSVLVNLNVFAQESSSVAESFISHQLVPDVVPIPPYKLVYFSSAVKEDVLTAIEKAIEIDETYVVKYPSGAILNLGNELNVADIAFKPSASWDAAVDQWYTLAMVDPDVPSRKFPIARELRHWLVVNIPGDNVDAGQTLSKYLSPTPPPGSGLHRYTFLVYLQPSKLTFDEIGFIMYNLIKPRTNFDIAEFAEQCNLGNPIAGNFFQAQLLGDADKLI